MKPTRDELVAILVTTLGSLGHKSLDIIITLQVILLTTTCLRCAVPSGRELMGDRNERLRSLPQRFVAPGRPATRLTSVPRASL